MVDAVLSSGWFSIEGLLKQADCFAVQVKSMDSDLASRQSDGLPVQDSQILNKTNVRSETSEGARAIEDQDEANDLLFEQIVQMK